MKRIWEIPTNGMHMKKTPMIVSIICYRLLGALPNTIKIPVNGYSCLLS